MISHVYRPWLGRLASLCITLGFAARGHAAPARGQGHDDPSTDAKAPLGVSFALDTGKVGLMPELFEKRLTHEVGKQLRDAGLEAKDGARGSIEIVLSSSGKDSAGFDYVVSGRLDGKPVVIDGGSGSCMPCTHEQTVGRVRPVVAQQLAAIVEADRAPSEAEPAGEEPSPAVPAVEGADPRTGGGDAPRRRLGKLGIAGAVLVPVGGIGIGAGIGMLVVDRRGENGDREGARGSDFTRPGIASAVVGAAALGAGIALLVVDRRSKRSSRVGVVPFGPRGIAVVGRF